MKVLFFITVKGHGRGGHFHSLNHITSALGERLEVGIYSIGIGKSDVIESNPWFLGHSFFNGRNFFTFKRRIKRNINDFNPDIIHCFDVSSYNILTMAINCKKRKIVVNKCGGPNPVTFPFIQNLILFSKENEKWFLNQQKFKDSSIYLIPNRVNKYELITKTPVEPLKKENAFCFVRIARIGTTYKKSIEDSIMLVERIIKTGHKNVHLYLIGTIEDEDVFAELKEKIDNLPITFLIEDQFTNKASTMLYLADAVIATGRGVMEATGLDKPILTPAKNTDLPILVNRYNFETFLATNFSQRNIASEADIRINLENICKLIKDKEFLENSKVQSKQFFEEYFDVKNGVHKYIQVYKGIKAEKQTNKNFLINIKYQLKTIYSFLRYAG